MNSELYTSEFRDFKFLKSSPAAINFYKKAGTDINKILPDGITDENFVWPTRLEFLEQLIDLRNETVYLVEPGLILSTDRDRSDTKYESARLRAIVNPMLFEGNPLNIDETRELTVDDVYDIENSKAVKRYWLCSAFNYGSEEMLDRVLSLGGNPLIPGEYISYAAFFYSKDWAELYQTTITDYLRKNHDAVSAITRLL